MRIEGLAYSVIHTPTLDYCHDPSHIRDRLFIEFGAAAAFIEYRMVGERYVSTHDGPEVRNQCFGGVLPFLEDASGDEVDVDVAPLQHYLQSATLNARRRSIWELAHRISSLF